MDFQKYQHIERYGREEVEGINIGTCYVFPKIDGTNSSCWLGSDGEIHFGSHHRELSLDNDNAGFMNTFCKDERLVKFFEEHPDLRLYGEFLVPHSLKTYRDSAWRKFYVFDVVRDGLDKEHPRYLTYNEYQPLLEEFELDYIPCIKVINNGSEEDFVHCLSINNFLIEDGFGTGEGVVIKNYNFVNRYGRTTWAKIVTSEFKEKHAKTMGAPVVERKMTEMEICDEFVTKALCEKEHQKIYVENGNHFENQDIPKLLNTVYHELICEEMWNILKKFKNPTIDFKTLQKACFDRTKKNLPNVF